MQSFNNNYLLAMIPFYLPLHKLLPGTLHPLGDRNRFEKALCLLCLLASQRNVENLYNAKEVLCIRIALIENISITMLKVSL